MDYRISRGLDLFAGRHDAFEDIMRTYVRAAEWLFVGLVAILVIAHAADPGLPSDHATAAFAIAVDLLTHRVGGLLVLGAAGVLAFGRVLLGVHYPTDVLAGAILCALVALLVTRLAARLPPLRLPTPSRSAKAQP